MFPELRPYKTTNEGIELQVKVTPKAASERIGDVFTDPTGANVLKIYITTAPEGGKANKAVIAMLAKKLGISKSSIQITSGFTDQRKCILIKELISEKALRMLV